MVAWNDTTSFLPIAYPVVPIAILVLRNAHPVLPVAHPVPPNAHLVLPIAYPVIPIVERNPALLKDGVW